MREDAVSNRSRIVASADQLVRQQGTTFRMDTLAASAGVAVGTLYRHFATKDALLAAVAERHASRLAAAARAALNQARHEGSARAALRRFYSLVADQYDMRTAASYVGKLLAEKNGLGAEFGEAASEALSELIAFAVAQREIRADATAGDILLFLERAPTSEDAERQRRFLFLIAEAMRP